MEDKELVESERFCFLMTVAKLFDDEMLDMDIARALNVGEDEVRRAIATVCMARINYSYTHSEKKGH